MAIVGQQNWLAVALAVRTEGRIETLSFTIQTKAVFDGKSLFGKAWFHAVFRASAVSWVLTVKAVTNRRKASILTDTAGKLAAALSRQHPRDIFEVVCC
ncbi:hypothetical protein [Burkholderia stabilis]